MVWIFGGQEEFCRLVTPFLSPFSLYQVLTPPKTASCSSFTLANTSQSPLFGISLFLGLKTVVDPDTFAFGDVGWNSF